MSSFSQSLNADDRKAYTSEHLARINKLVREQPKIEDETDLEKFLETLPTDLAYSKEKVEIFLRHRDIIVYTHLNPMQSALFCFSLRGFIPMRDHKNMENFLEGSQDKINLSRTVKSLTRTAISHSRLSLACFSLLYLLGEMVEGEESTPPTSADTNSEQTITTTPPTSADTNSEQITTPLTSADTNSEQITTPLTSADINSEQITTPLTSADINSEQI